MNTRSVLLILLVSATLTGCISRTVKLDKSLRPLKAETVSKAALLDMLKERSQAVTTLSVEKPSFKLSTPLSPEKNKEYASILISGTIFVDRPSRMRIQIDYGVFTAVDLVSDGSQYKVSVPKKSQFGVADVSAPVEAADFPYTLRPSHILDALFVDGEQYIDDKSVVIVRKETNESQADGLHSYYVIEFLRGDVLIEELWFDRYFTEIARKIKYKDDGRVESDVRYSKYEKVDGIPFPRLIMFDRPIEHYSLEMKLEKLEMNKPIDPEVFKMERPEGADDLNLITGKVIKH